VCPTNCGLPFQASELILVVCLFLTSCDAISLSFVSCTTVSFLHTEYKKSNVVSTCKMYFFPYSVSHYEVQFFSPPGRNITCICSLNSHLRCFLCTLLCHLVVSLYKLLFTYFILSSVSSHLRPLQ